MVVWRLDGWPSAAAHLDGARLPEAWLTRTTLPRAEKQLPLTPTMRLPEHFFPIIGFSALPTGE